MPTTLDDYEVLYTIGSGSYGTCKKIKRKQDGKILVWKEMDYGQMSETEKQLLVSEVNLLRELKHQNIVRYYDRIIDRTNTMLYLVMEYCEGGDLGSLISRMKREGRTVEEDFVWKICIQVLSALKLCHSRSLNGKTVLHRDLKPANVFLDSASNVKLGDFGLARVLNHDTSFAKTFVGTPYYMSPEQMNYMSYNEKSDIWSLGCLLYELCTLRPPFTASNQTELAAKICVGQFTRIPVRYSDELQTVIEVMLQVDGKKRPSVSELCDHPCLSKRMVSSQHQSISSVKSSGSADEGYESLKKKKKALKAKEEALAAREKDLEQKERELQEKERTLAIREKLAEERLSKAEKLIKEYSQLKTKYQELTEANQDLNSSLSSCLSKGKKDPDTPKKQVTFHTKEKELLGAITDNLHKMNTGKDKYDSRVRNNTTANNGVPANSKDYDLNDRYKRAKERSEELKRLEWESKLRTRALLAIR